MLQIWTCPEAILQQLHTMVQNRKNKFEIPVQSIPVICETQIINPTVQS